MDRAYLEWQALAKQGSIGNEWEDQTIQRRKDLLVRRMKLAKDFLQTNLKPEWMVLDLLPVLPPELRPIVELYEGELITSDLNELYRKIIHRNNTLIEFLSGSEFGHIVDQAHSSTQISKPRTNSACVKRKATPCGFNEICTIPVYCIICTICCLRNLSTSKRERWRGLRCQLWSGL